MNILLELKKIVLNKFFIISFILVVAYLVFAIDFQLDYFPNDGFEDRDKFFSSFEYKPGITGVEINDYISEITSQAFDDRQLPEEQRTPGKYGKDLMADWHICIDVRDTIKHIENGYQNDMIETILVASQNKLSAQANGEKYLEKYNDKVIEKYNKKRNLDLYDTENVEACLDMFHDTYELRMFSVLLIVWTCFISAYCFHAEKSNKCNEAVFSTKKGRWQLFASKVIALLIILLVIALVLFGIEMYFAVNYFNITAFDAPVQSMIKYEYCTFDISVMGMILLMNLMRFMALVFAVAVTAVLCIKAKHIIRPVIIGFLFFGGLGYMLLRLGLLETLEKTKALAHIRAYLPLSLAHPYTYFNLFDYENILGFPVNRLMSCSVVFAVVTVACIFISAKFYGKAGKYNG